MKPKPIILVEDSPRDTELALEALRELKLPNPIVTLRDGAEALDYFFRLGTFAACTDDLPAVVLLDLKMPRVDGIEVLRQLKADPAMKVIPIVMMTSSREEHDVVRCYQHGVNAYVVKPLGFRDFTRALQAIGAFWATLNELPAPPPAPPRPA